MGPLLPQTAVLALLFYGLVGRGLTAPPEAQASTLQATATLSSQGQQAFAVLSNSSCFKSASVGMGGTPPPEELAFRDLLCEADALQAFRDLTNAPALPARMYGLRGLAVLSEAVFLLRSNQLLQAGGSVCTLNGCIQAVDSVQHLVQAIASHRRSNHLETDR